MVPPTPKENEDHERRMKLEGVRLEKERWLKAFREAGLPMDATSSPESVAKILRWKLMVAKEYAWETVKNAAKKHAEACQSVCSAEILLELKDKQRKNEGPPLISGPDDEEPFQP